MTGEGSVPGGVSVVGKVLAIQSHVVHGYVGNRAATFPLQYRGWDVDALNTVQYSNHLGYGQATGFKYSGEELCSVFRDGLLKAMGNRYDAIITGYTPSAQVLEDISGIIKNQLNQQQDLKWIVDPVLGDNGRLYVSEDIVPVYKRLLSQNKIFLATPNQFEMELLSESELTDLESASTAVSKFFQLYPHVERLVVTSVVLAGSDDYVVIAADRTTSPQDTIYIRSPRIKCHFSGSGDLFTALLVDALLRDRESTKLSQAVAKSQWMIGSVLQRTYEQALKSGELKDQDSPVIKDLKLIQCRELFRLHDIPEIPITGHINVPQT
ncbi:Phosphomethylpyrimidine kinase [Nakaseomyces glabratus]|nr:Phosphomethylpyrimidine kinase [Nakaseomyces glabratus]KAH7580378.1 Phosphomethylpyrimidine kinase [Nakaseomyces glabratus]KAI8382092.1 Phosphomethylpyrimidine kinase [Nakaseomyces glabratus]KAI8392319.1 Phosphomethylpyrimidine kinase [Nakaseomyces glabratus]KAJ9573013.1 bud site selection protein [Nakaseomyces glabratus]